MSSFRALLNQYREDFIEHVNYETLKLFLFELCQEKDINLYREMENACPEDIEAKFHLGVKRLLQQEPLAHVLGYCYFNGNRLLVNKDVLIPRYETEELVMNILMECDTFFQEYQQIDAVDIGTGSGAIAISLAKDEKKMYMYASDISEAAIAMAKQNATLNDVEIQFYCGDMLQPLIDHHILVDLLVSNPPYIPIHEELEKSVKEFEPHVALFADESGLRYYQEILSNCHKILKPRAMIAFEIGYNQKEALQSLCQKYLPNAEFNCIQDINQKDRMVIIKVK